LTPLLVGNLQDQKEQLTHFAQSNALSEFETAVLLELSDDFITEIDFCGLKNMQCANTLVI
jgi:hypothetical protein